MNITILSSAKEVTEQNTQGKIVVVIDVLRATTVMVTALFNGAKSIHPFKSIESVLEESKKVERPILSGERRGLKIDGFDLGNSPLEYKREIVENREIFMTTSNGTRAIESALKSKMLYIASFLNISAISKELLEQNEDVVIICAGTDDEFSLDDALCAGLIVKKLENQTSITMSDFSRSILRVAQLELPIETILEGSKHYSYLKSIGFEGDLEHCFSVDLYDIAPQYKKGIVTI